MRFSLLIYFILSILFISQGNAQDKDTLEKEILNFVDKDEEILKNSRKLLLHSISTMNDQKTAQVFDYLKDKYDGSSKVALWPYERWYVYFLLQRHSDYLNEVANFEMFFKSFEKKIRPPQDNFNLNVATITSQSFAMLLQNVNDSLATEDHDFLIVGLYSMLAQDINFISQDSLNGIAQKFLSVYAGSRYAPFIKKYILEEYRLSNAGLGLSAGTGLGLLTGLVSKSFSNFVPLDYSIDITFKKVFFGFNVSLSGSNVKREFMESGQWLKNSRASATLFNLYVGYDVTSLSSPFFEIKNYRIIPYLFTGILEFSNGKSESPEYKSMDLFAYGCGVKNDFKITKRKARTYSYTPAIEYFYAFIRIEPSVGIVSLENNKNFNGTYIKISATVGFFTRLIKKVDY